MKRKILILGGSYMNLQMKIDPTDKNDNVVSGAEYKFHPYGAAAAAAISISKLGGDCLFGTKFGDDTYGKRLYEYYKGCGMKTGLMKKSKDAQTGMSVTLYRDCDFYDTYLSRGVSASFTRRDVDDAFATTPDMFLVPQEELGPLEPKVEAETPEEDAPEVQEALGGTDGEAENASDAESAKAEQGTADEESEKKNDWQNSLSYYAIRKAADQQIDLIMQYTPFTANYPLDKIENLKILVISDKMLYSLTGFFPNSTDKALRSLVALSQRVKAKYYVIQQGESSTFIYDGKFYEVVSAPASMRTVTKNQEKEMQSTFMGALATEYLESKNIIRACHFATVVSLLSRSKFGNVEKAPTRAELEAYALQNGIDLYR